MPSKKVILALGYALGGLLVIAAIAARFFAAGRQDFWLDEIWSWAFTDYLHSPWELVTEARHDNNHILNTWIIQVVGPPAHWFWYRLPAALAGTGAIFACAWLASAWGRTATLVTAILTATSYLMIQYSSEARGYAYLLLLAPLALCLLRAAHDGGRALWAIPFVVTVVLGLLAHATFYVGYCACLGYSAADLFRRRPERPADYWKRWLLISLSCHLVPLGVAGGLYAIHYREMKSGGGPEQSMLDTMGEFCSLASGGPQTGWAMWPVAAVGLAIVGLGMWRMTRGDVRWGVFFAVLVVAQIVICAIRPAPTLHCRYFLLWLPFFLCAGAVALSALAARGVLGKLAAAALVLFSLSGNTVNTAEFLRVGRGDTLGALEMIIDLDPGGEHILGSSQDTWASLSLVYYLPLLPEGTRMSYVELGNWPATGVDWLLVPLAELSPSIEDSIRGGDQVYQLVKVFPRSGLSGVTLAVYRRAPG